MGQYVGGTEFMVLAAACAGLALLAVAAVVRRWVGWPSALATTGFVWWLVVIALATLVPLDAIDLTMPAGSRLDECSLDYGGPAPDGFWILSGTQRTLNTALFVPAGVLMVLAVARSRTWWAYVVPGLVVLAAYSVVIELVQLEVARIGRACDITDMVDNITGALLGTLAGVLLAALLRPWLRRRPSPAGGPH